MLGYIRSEGRHNNAELNMLKVDIFIVSIYCYHVRPLVKREYSQETSLHLFVWILLRPENYRTICVEKEGSYEGSSCWASLKPWSVV